MSEKNGGHGEAESTGGAHAAAEWKVYINRRALREGLRHAEDCAERS